MLIIVFLLSKKKALTWIKILTFYSFTYTSCKENHSVPGRQFHAKGRSKQSSAWHFQIYGVTACHTELSCDDTNLTWWLFTAVPFLSYSACTAYTRVQQALQRGCLVAHKTKYTDIDTSESLHQPTKHWENRLDNKFIRCKISSLHMNAHFIQ